MRPIDADTMRENIRCEVQRTESLVLKHELQKWIDNQPTIGGWISVKDRLPENGQLVVVRHEVKGRIYSEVVHYIMDLWWLDWDTNGLELNAISWIPLPEPQEEVSDDVD